LNLPACVLAWLLIVLFIGGFPAIHLVILLLLPAKGSNHFRKKLIYVRYKTLGD
tara:strand:+ start:420 stop:581 length:162 start_codon:yes stop_codon:yes gene_type:complete